MVKGFKFFLILILLGSFIFSNFSLWEISTAQGAFKEEKIKQFREFSDRREFDFVSGLPGGGISTIKVSKVLPEVVLGKWNNEVQLKVRRNIQGISVRNGNRQEFRGQKEEFHIYPLEPQKGMENGGLELEVLLKEKPTTNKFDFTIEGAENLNFFYQGALTQEEIDLEGAVRPENVIGSYAVYHKTKKNHVIGSTNYGTGKVFHIYRPKAVDANGVEEWGELNYRNGVLSVTLPQEWLNAATYPVIVDPTFGDTTAVGSSVNFPGANAKSASQFSLTENGDVSKLTAYFADQDSGHVGGTLKGVIYDTSGSTPNALKGTTAENTQA